MKLFTTLIFVLLLSGCNQTVTGKDMEIFLETCKPYGGVDYVVAGNSADNHKDVAYCKEKGISVRGED